MLATGRAMVCEEVGKPLRLVHRPRPRALGEHDVVIDVCACGVCRTDLHVVDGDLPRRTPTIVPGHEIVGRVAEVGPAVSEFAPGARVGAAWLATACGTCEACRRGEENLCPNAGFHGWTRDGGYADAMVADARFIFPLAEGLSDEETAPLLCAGLIGYRALRLAGEARRLGIYGFGAAGHIVAQTARWLGQQVFAFTRRDDRAAQDLALALGAVWAGASDEVPPEELDAAIIFAPVGQLVPLALKAVRRGGTVVCAGIHMSDIPSFPYELLWGERVLRSVANLTRRDGREFLELAPRVPIRTTVEVFPLEEANEALARLREGRISGAAVIGMERPAASRSPVT
ncbi:zinc-dependent alcohol dehydrogenase family protein [Chelatococcus sp. SYSU_G07232]|uniref:alcohol dehydrogenase n=1 Tax=Chelatococcus albus TaxID=3047466 RepID=A0ABT7ABE8_9HYPH|nr:zinc-dependent alcohol dehydrogenase family protein [Chelatococcus sp. SYSU_G07232]MDJ1156688.1 zinc-dependent alcohol dehydrogenase family protein [Chelatococcus sp. SYSU_G07232]